MLTIDTDDFQFQIEPVVIEREFKLSLQALDLGAILGEWHFQPVSPDGACVTGHCGLDQTFLGEMLRGVKSLLLFAETRSSE